MAFEREQFPAVNGVPHPGRAIFTRRRQPFAIRRPGHARDVSRMPLEVKYFLATGWVPHLRGAIGTPCRQELPIRRPGHYPDRFTVADQHLQLEVALALPVI